MDSSPADSDSMGIFKSICELMTDIEFVRSSAEFFDKNCEVFDENVEENKHEYK